MSGQWCVARTRVAFGAKQARQAAGDVRGPQGRLLVPQLPMDWRLSYGGALRETLSPG